MNSDSLMVACVSHLMTITNQKLKTQNSYKQYYHSHLLIQHFIESKSIFNTKNKLHQSLKAFYTKEFLIQTQNIHRSKNEIANQNVYIHEMIQLSQKERLLTQILVRLIIVALQSVLNVNIDRKMHKQLKMLNENLQLQLILEGEAVSDLLLRFIPKLTDQIVSLPFYQFLLKLFTQLDYFLIINHLQSIIQKLKADWNQLQKQKKQQIGLKSTKPMKRQSLFMPIKASQSLQGNNKLGSLQSKMFQKPEKQKTEKLQKALIKQNSEKVLRTNFKKPTPIQTSSRRRTIYQDTKYQFHTNRKSTIYEVQTSYQDNKIYQYSKYCQVNNKEIDIDVLAERTPQRKKKNIARK